MKGLCRRNELTEKVNECTHCTGEVNVGRYARAGRTFKQNALVCAFKSHRIVMAGGVVVLGVDVWRPVTVFSDQLSCLPSEGPQVTI